MWGELKCGTLVFVDKLPFADGGSADKLVLVLGNKGGSEIPVALTTSVSPPNLDTPGCHANRGYYACTLHPRDCFKVKTFIQLYRVGILTPRVVASAEWKEKARIIGTVSAETMRAIINCAKKCPDVSERHRNLMGEN